MNDYYEGPYPIPIATLRDWLAEGIEAIHFKLTLNFNDLIETQGEEDFFNGLCEILDFNGLLSPTYRLLDGSGNTYTLLLTATLDEAYLAELFGPDPDEERERYLDEQAGAL
jgi:hypothetical protein